MAEPGFVLVCRNWKRRRTRRKRNGWSLNGKGGNEKRSASERGSDATARGRRNGRGNGKESANGRETETKIVTVGPEKENEIEIGRRTEAETEAAPGTETE